MSGIGAVIGVAMLGAFVVLPAISDTAFVRSKVENALSRWMGGKVAFTGPVELSYFPGVSLKANGFTFAGGAVPLIEKIDSEQATFSLGLPDLIRGRIAIDKFRLKSPNITLKNEPSSGTALERMSALLNGTPVERVRISDGSISYGAEGGQLVSSFDADIRLKGSRGALTSSGSFRWRDEPVHYEFRGGRAALGAGGRVPFRLTVTSPRLMAHLDGNARAGDGLTLDGRLDVAMNDVRGTMRWMGASVPDGAGLRDFQAAGRMQWAGRAIAFEDGAYAMDGNNAVGALEVRFDGARPRIEGTLAFDRMSLAPYLTPIRQALATGADPFDLPLSHNFDVDVRISANAVDAGGLMVDQVALTLSLNDGVLRSDVAEISVCGGSGSGTLLIDSKAVASKVRMNAALTGVASEACLGDTAIAGLSDIKTEITTEGKDSNELLASASGKINAQVGQGQMELDLAKLATDAERGVVKGWSRGGRTAFESLSAECRMQDGLMRCPIFAMKLPSGSVSGGGEINLAAQNIDWTIFVRNDLSGAPAGAQENAAKGFLIRGPLWDPSIRRSTTDLGMLAPGAVEGLDRPHMAWLGMNLRR